MTAVDYWLSFPHANSVLARFAHPNAHLSAKLSELATFWILSIFLDILFLGKYCRLLAVFHRPKWKIKKIVPNLFNFIGFFLLVHKYNTGIKMFWLFV
jgi:hypothetical protein